MRRLFAQSSSLQNLPKEFKEAIKCHPSILLQYSKTIDIKSDALEYYVNNRNKVVEKIMTDYSLEKGDVKQLFLSVMNGGKRDGILDPFFVKFKTECERILTFIDSLNPKLLKDVCKKKNLM
jgi:hypothetical protein